MISFPEQDVPLLEASGCVNTRSSKKPFNTLIVAFRLQLSASSSLPASNLLRTVSFSSLEEKDRSRCNFVPRVSKVAIMIIRTCDQFFNLGLLTSDCETRVLVVLLHIQNLCEELLYVRCCCQACMHKYGATILNLKQPHGRLKFLDPLSFYKPTPPLIAAREIILMINYCSVGAVTP